MYITPIASPINHQKFQLDMEANITGRVSRPSTPPPPPPGTLSDEARNDNTEEPTINRSPLSTTSGEGDGGVNFKDAKKKLESINLIHGSRDQSPARGRKPTKPTPLARSKMSGRDQSPSVPLRSQSPLRVNNRDQSPLARSMTQGREQSPSRPSRPESPSRQGRSRDRVKPSPLARTKTQSPARLDTSIDNSQSSQVKSHVTDSNMSNAIRRPPPTKPPPILQARQNTGNDTNDSSDDDDGREYAIPSN